MRKKGRKEVSLVKQLANEVNKFTMDAISAHEQRLLKGAMDAKIKMPYKMFMGMRKKTVERQQKKETANKEMDIIAESGGFKKPRLMEQVFAQREENKRKAKQQAKVERKIKFEQMMRREREKKQELFSSVKRDNEQAGGKPGKRKKGFAPQKNTIKKFH
eukprot:TRINITY_DN9456_c0_g2_i2.p2 TRINITY_DN9456_c0_g2~~TRINITY_DN9456_c0_g2_i2.p2  ORF type:complete len:160 (-),score=58.10 TRINITY_DN9456_c0_g2_i2:121-600(-)